jgi:hypothetical protein
MRYGPPSTEQVLGALPVVAGFCRRLDIAGIIDRAAPVREIAHATHGQVIEALIANRLTSPTPMVHAGAWARQFAVGQVFGLESEVLNDDRIARALDALAPVLERVTGSVAAAAIAVYGVDVSQLYWDMTSVSLFGDYPDCDRDYPQPRFGHPKDRRPDLKQIQAGIAAAADGAVPVFWQPYGGGAGEVAQVIGAMEALRRLAGPRRFLLIGDSKLLSYTNIAAMIDARVTFLAPASKLFVPAAVLGSCDYATATPVDYTAQRDTTGPPEQRGHYRVAEDTMTITGPRKKDPAFTLRRVFVYSSARANAAAVARSKKLDRARNDLTRLTRGLGSPLPDRRRGHRQGHHDRPRTPRRRLPAHQHQQRRHRAAHPRLVLRPGRPRRRGRHQRLVRAAHQPPRDGHRRAGTDPLQRPARHQRTALPRPERTARRRTHVPAHQPAHHRTHRRHLPRPAHLLPGRTRSPPQPRTRHQTRRPLRRTTRQTHRQPHPHRPRHPAPTHQPRRNPRDRPARRRTTTPTRPTQHRSKTHTLTPEPTAPHVRNPGLAAG